MEYLMAGTTHQTDDEGYLLEANLRDEAARVIAQAEDIVSAKQVVKAAGLPGPYGKGGY